jgi:hypothetical protein
MHVVTSYSGSDKESILWTVGMPMQQSLHPVVCVFSVLEQWLYDWKLAWAPLAYYVSVVEMECTYIIMKFETTAFTYGFIIDVCVWTPSS